MKRAGILLLIVIAITAAFVSCKKYEDGSSISTLSIEKKMVGKWEFKMAIWTYDGSNVTDHWYYHTIGLAENFSYQEIIPDLDEMLVGTWTLDMDKDYLIVTSEVDGVWISLKYKILKLSKDELWLQSPDVSRPTELRYSHM